MIVLDDSLDGQKISITEEQEQKIREILGIEEPPIVTIGKCAGWHNRLRVKMTESVKSNLRAAIESPTNSMHVFCLDQGMAWAGRCVCFVRMFKDCLIITDHKGNGVVDRPATI